MRVVQCIRIFGLRYFMKMIMYILYVLLYMLDYESNY